MRFLSWLGFGRESQEDIRGVTDQQLPFVETGNLSLIALARLMECVGCDDRVLIQELYKRGRKNADYVPVPRKQPR